jgi:serine protease Do
MSIIDKLRTQKFLSFALVLFTLSVGVVIGTVVSTGVKAAKENAVAPGAAPLDIPSPVQLSTQFSQLAKTLEPSVVNISSTYLPKQTRQSQPRAQQRRRNVPDEGDEQGMEDFFRRFFGSPFGPMDPDEGFPGGGRRAGLGSGVVVDKAGYILTNNHVIDKADRIQVKFAGDAQEYDAKLIGADALTDLAVIRVTGRDVTPAKIGNSDSVQVGDWAVAIGSPFGFQATVTAGIISAKERDIPGDTSQFQHFLQTDAAINPGNSGGPLLNIRGEVIGINTAIASRSGGYQGIGFALPMNTAVKVYNEIIRTGKVTRGGIGVSFRQSDAPGTRELLKAYGATEGLFVQEVAPGGPGEKAGIQAEDIIVAVNGQPVRTGSDLIDRITATPLGNTVQVTVLRDKKRITLPVVVADLTKIFPDRFGAGETDEAAPTEGTQAKFGISIENLGADRRRALNFEREGGVYVAEVTPASFADDIGMLPRDILLAINRQPVSSVEDVKRIQATLKPGDAVAFQVMRQDRGTRRWVSLFLAGALPANGR